MEIRDIQTAVIEANYDWTIVKVITDEDIIGYGECFFAPGLTKVIHELKPLLIGEDGRDIDRLCRLLREAGATSGSGTGGIILHAIAGIETALWDAYAKWLDVPLFRLLAEPSGSESEFTPIATPVKDWQASRQFAPPESLGG